MEKATASSKTQRWQFSVRISDLSVMGICDFGNLIFLYKKASTLVYLAPTPDVRLPWEILQVSTQENVRGAEVERFLLLQILYIFFFAEVLGSSCVKRDFLCNQEKNRNNTLIYPPFH